MRLIAEDWAQLWPNVFAVSIWTVILFLWHHYRLKKHIYASHEKLARHVTEQLAGKTEKEMLPSEEEAP